MSEVLLKVNGLKKYFPLYKGVLKRKVGEVKALDAVSFELKKGETLGIVGESGCGKSTLVRTLLKLYEPTAGEVLFKGQGQEKYVDFVKLSNRDLLPYRQYMAMIFQDPMESLNPAFTIEKILNEPFVIHQGRHCYDSKAKVREKIFELLEQVSLPKQALKKYPHEFSGGQRQRVCIARAIALNPQILICDEAVSALDVSIQAQILNLLIQIQRDLELSILFISHNMSVVRYISDYIMVINEGKVVESAEAVKTLQKSAK